MSMLQDYNSCWKVLPAHVGDIVRLEGEPVPANAQVVIQHAKTCQDLSSDSSLVFQ